MSQTIQLVPGGPPVEVFGEIVSPAAAPLKIDLWRYVRHPPPELLHVATIKQQGEPGVWFAAGDADNLIGKVITWVWDCRDLPHDEAGWRIRVDVRQGGVSIPGYPVEYTGPIPRRRPLTTLRIAEPVEARPRNA